MEGSKADVLSRTGWSFTWDSSSDMISGIALRVELLKESVFSLKSSSMREEISCPVISAFSSKTSSEVMGDSMLLIS